MLISVVNTKGGTGKTTTALYLAEAARRAGKKVTVWDADPQGTAIAWSDYASNEGVPLQFEVVGIHPRYLDRESTHDGIVIIDTPPGNPATISAAIRRADVVAVVTGPGGADVDRALETMQAASNARAALVLLTQFIKTETESWETWNSLRSSDLPVFDTRIPRRAAIQRSYGSDLTGDLFGYDRLLEEIVEVDEHMRSVSAGE